MNFSDVLTIIFGILGMISGTIGLIISILTYRNAKFEVINSFFQYVLDTEFIKSRRFVYNLPENKDIEEMSQKEQRYAAIVTNAYEHWGLLVKRKKMPLWLFYDKHENELTSSGIAAIRLYNRLKIVIYYRRSHGNKRYAMNYTWLYDELINKVPTYKNYKE